MKATEKNLIDARAVIGALWRGGTVYAWVDGRVYPADLPPSSATSVTISCAEADDIPGDKPRELQGDVFVVDIDTARADGMVECVTMYVPMRRRPKADSHEAPDSHEA